MKVRMHTRIMNQTKSSNFYLVSSLVNAGLNISIMLPMMMDCRGTTAPPIKELRIPIFRINRSHLLEYLYSSMKPACLGYGGGPAASAAGASFSSGATLAPVVFLVEESGYSFVVSSSGLAF